MSVCPCRVCLTSSAPGAMRGLGGLLLRLLSGTFFLLFFAVLLFCTFFTGCGAARPGAAPPERGPARSLSFGSVHHLPALPRSSGLGVSVCPQTPSTAGTPPSPPFPPLAAAARPSTLHL